MDIFCEYMVKRKKTIIDSLIVLGSILAGLILSLAVIAFNKYLFNMEVFVLAGIWYGAYYLMRSTYVEYEYTLTSTELDIDKIMGKRRRKNILTVDFKEVEICTDIRTERYYNEYQNSPSKVLDFTGVGQDTTFFADFSLNGERTRILFNPSEKMIENLRLANPRVVHL